ncbi:MAG: hypothetical protein J7603_01490, partial [Pseudacidovorax sp.]|nr:hypothetical protein [Pseudacidovorax sp.]
LVRLECGTPRLRALVHRVGLGRELFELQRRDPCKATEPRRKTHATHTGTGLAPRGHAIPFLPSIDSLSGA